MGQTWEVLPAEWVWGHPLMRHFATTRFPVATILPAWGASPYPAYWDSFQSAAAAFPALRSGRLISEAGFGG